MYKFCSNKVDARLSLIQERIQGLKESLNSETKSSAGDKHETGRAMLQLEREKLGRQLLEAEKARQRLRSVRIENSSSKVCLGSLVHTTTKSYFIAISSGEYLSERPPIFCISPGTPIGKLLLGKEKGDFFTFNSETIKIEEIY